MPEILIESATFTEDVTVVTGGDARTAANLKPAFQSLANRTRYLNQSWFPVANAKSLGCIGNGTADDTVKAQLAIDTAALFTKRVYFPPGTYKITSGLIGYSDLTIELAPGAVLDFSTAPDGTMCLSAAGTEAATLALAADGAEGATVVTLASVTGLAKGDLIRVSSTTVFDDFNTDSELGELVRIESVAAPLVNLETPLRSTYTVAATAVVSKVTPVKNLTIQGGTIRGGGTLDASGVDRDHVGFRVFLGENVAVHNVRFERCDLTSAWLWDTIESKVVGCHFSHQWNDNEAYGVSFDNACQDCIAYGNTFVDVRHSMTTANSTATRGITRRIVFANNTVNDSSKARGGSGGDSIDTHGAAEDIFILGNSVFKSSGGGINVECRRAKIHDNFVAETADYGIIYHNETDFEGEVSICGNEVRNATWEGIRANMPTRGANQTKNRSVVINNNQVSGARIGIYVLNSTGTAQMTAVSCVGNVVKGCTSSSGSIYLQNVDGGTVVGNVVSEPTDLTQQLIRLRDCQNCTVVGNTCRHMTGATGVGIYINASGPSNCTNICITGNLVTGFTPSNLRGVVIDDDATNCTVATNHLKGCNTAIVPGIGAGHDIPSVITQIATIATGVVTLTSGYIRELVVDTEGALPTDDLFTINGGVAGQIIVVRTLNSARDVTLKNGGGGNLLLGADFTLLTGNDTATLQFNGTSSWRKLAAATN